MRVVQKDVPVAFGHTFELVPTTSGAFGPHYFPTVFYTTTFQRAVEFNCFSRSVIVFTFNEVGGVT